jgi:hypothetical protein
VFSIQVSVEPSPKVLWIRWYQRDNNNPASFPNEPETPYVNEDPNDSFLTGPTVDPGQSVNMVPPSATKQYVCAYAWALFAPTQVIEGGASDITDVTQQHTTPPKRKTAKKAAKAKKKA